MKLPISAPKLVGISLIVLILIGAVIYGLTRSELLSTPTVPLMATATGDLTGTVSGHDGEMPVSGAQVTLDTGESIQTDDNGEFTFTEVPVGERTVQVEAPLYSSTEESISVEAEDDNQVEITLSIDPPADGSLVLAQYRVPSLAGNTTLIQADGTVVTRVPDSAGARFGDDGLTLVFQFEREMYKVYLDGSGRKKISDTVEFEPEAAVSPTSADGEYTLEYDANDLYVTEIVTNDGDTIFTFPERSTARWANETNTVVYTFLQKRPLEKKLEKVVIPENFRSGDVLESEEVNTFSYSDVTINMDVITWNNDGSAFIDNDTVYTLSGDVSELPSSNVMFLPDGRLILSILDTSAADYEVGTFLFSEAGKELEKLSPHGLQLHRTAWNSDQSQAILTDATELYILDVDELTITEFVKDSEIRMSYNTVSWYQEP